MKQSQDMIHLSDVLNVFDEWIARGKMYYWSQDPADIRQGLINDANEDGILSYQRAVQILYAAKTDKLIGTADAGIQYIRQEWKKLKFRGENLNKLDVDVIAATMK